MGDGAVLTWPRSSLWAGGSRGDGVVPGQTVLSGDKDGLVAVSHSRTGMTFRVLSDHQGAAISTICVTRKEVKQPQEPGSRGRGAGGGRHHLGRRHISAFTHSIPSVKT